jgi:predicted dehydrogenase
MRFLIAGLGSVGRRHLRNLMALGERDIILYRTFRSTLPNEDLPDLPVETSLEAALAHNPNAVIVANPTAFHLDVAIPAAEMGCHLLLEKPLSNSLDGVEKLRTAIGQAGGEVLVGFQFRFHPGLVKVRQWLLEGRIGRPLSARAVYGEYLPQMHPWEDYRRSYSAREELGGGVILTLCHPLDYFRWFLGEVEDIWSFSGRLNDFEITVEDTAEIGIRFKNGVIGSIHLDYNQRPASHRLEIVGTEGTLRWDNADGSALAYTPGSESQGDENAGTWEFYSPPEAFARNDMFLAEMRHFLSVVRGENEPICTLLDGMHALELAQAAHTSQKENRLVTLNI